jgi:hypothetical protein
MEEATRDETPHELGTADAETPYRIIQPKYEKLAAEIEYILQESLVEERVPIASLTKRVKSVGSFAGKLRPAVCHDILHFSARTFATSPMPKPAFAPLHLGY